MSIPPIVRQMVLCDAVEREPGNRSRYNIRGLVHTIHAKPAGHFPIIHPELCVYLVLTGGVGQGRCRVVIAEADTGDAVAASAEHTISYPPHRLHIGGAVFRLLDCVFPRAGLYWVEFHHDGMVVRSVPLSVR